MGEIRDPQGDLGHPFLGDAQRLLQLLDTVAQLFHGGHQRIGRLPAPLQPGDLL
jgi:hypothetical protein